MQEFINHLIEKTGISSEQAEKVIHAVTDYVKEKFPMMAGAVDNLFTKGESAAENAGGSIGDKAEGIIDSVKDKLSGLLG